MGHIRVFIAIDIPQETKDDIARVQKQLSAKLKNSNARWIPARNLHITLKFIGETTYDKINGLKQTLHSISESKSSFVVSHKEFAFFPTLKQPRVLAIRFNDSAELEALQQEIVSGCQTLGYSKERTRFHPHLTIARIKEKASIEDKDRIEKIVSETKVDLPGIFRVDSFHLYKSELQSTGAEYKKLFSALLSTR